jgi:hypothetical protein
MPIPVLHHELAAVEKRLSQIAINLGFHHLTPGQRNSLFLEQTTLANSLAAMSPTSQSKDDVDRAESEDMAQPQHAPKKRSKK